MHSRHDVKAPVASPPPRREDSQPITKITYSKPVSEISYQMLQTTPASKVPFNNMPTKIVQSQPVSEMPLNHMPQRQQSSPAVQAPQNATTVVRKVVQRSPAPPLLRAPSPANAGAPKVGSGAYLYPSPKYLSQDVVQPQHMEQRAGGVIQQGMGAVPQQGAMYASAPTAINSSVQNQAYAQQIPAAHNPQTPFAHQPPKQLFQSPLALEQPRRLASPLQNPVSPPLKAPLANYTTPDSAVLRDMSMMASRSKTPGSGGGSAAKEAGLFSSQRRPGRPGEYEETLRKDRLARLLQTFNDFEADILRTTTNMTRTGESFNPFVPPVADPAQPRQRFSPSASMSSPIPPPVPTRSPALSPSTIGAASATRVGDMSGKSPESDRLGALINAYDRIKASPGDGTKAENKTKDATSPSDSLKKDLAHLQKANEAMFEKLDIAAQKNLEGLASHPRSPPMFIEQDDSLKGAEKPAARPEQAARAIIDYMTPVAGLSAAKLVGDILKQMSLSSGSDASATDAESGLKAEETPKK